MKFKLLDFIDTTNMSAEELKHFQALESAIGKGWDDLDASVKGYLSDELKIDDLRKGIKDAIDMVNEVKKDGEKYVESDLLEKKMKEIETSLIRLKAATENTDKGIKIKSVEQQIREQFKGYIVSDETSNGPKETLNLKKACQDSPGGKKIIQLVLDRKDASTIMSGSLVPHFGAEVDTTIGVSPRYESIIRRYATVGRTTSRSLIIAEYESKDGDAAWVPEGGLKPLMDATLKERTVSAGKVAVRAKFTEETLSDLPQFVKEVESEMINKLGVKEEMGILNGSGSGGEISGVATQMPSFSLTGDNVKTDKPNYYDAIVWAYTQIYSTSEMAYTPNVVLMNPLDYAAMQLTKDANGQYLRPFKVNDELIKGLRIETTTGIEQGNFIIGDFSYLNIRDLAVLTITIGWENDDFSKNLVTVIAEKRLMAYIKSQYDTAFVKDSFETIIEAITPVSVDTLEKS